MIHMSKTLIQSTLHTGCCHMTNHNHKINYSLCWVWGICGLLVIWVSYLWIKQSTIILPSVFTAITSLSCSFFLQIRKSLLCISWVERWHAPPCWLFSSLCYYAETDTNLKVTKTEHKLDKVFTVVMSLRFIGIKTVRFRFQILCQVTPGPL